MTEVRFTKTFDNHQTVDELTVAETKARKYNRFQDWTCTVGTNCIYIDFDGMVWRGPCHVGGTLGNMLTDWKIPEDTVVCNKWTCDCGTGIKLPKWFEEVYRAEPIEPQLFNVQWDLSRRCNYDCSYCWPNSHNKTDRWIPVEVLHKVVDKILEQRSGKLQFNFAGGEPTLHPGFLDLCGYIWEKGHHIHVQTNGTMNENKARILASMAEISISVHFEFANFKKLARNITAILDGPNNGLEIKMMISPYDTADHDAGDFMRYLEAIPNIEHARIIRTPLRDPVSNDLMQYTSKQLEEFGDVTC